MIAEDRKLDETADTARQDLSALRINRDDDDDSGNPRMKAVLVGTLLLVAAGAALIGYRTWSAATLPEVVAARALVESGDTGVEVLTATGYVIANRRAAVSPKISGRLEYLGVDTGSEVRAGQILARLEHRDLTALLENARGELANWEAAKNQAEAELEEARASLAQAEANFRRSSLDLERQTSLVEKGVASRADYDNAVAQARVDEAAVKAAQARIRAAEAYVVSAEAQIRAAKARLQNAEAQIEYTNVRAPFDGVVISKDAEVGETVAPAIFGGTSTRGSVVTIVDPGSFEVEADINESSIGRIAMGMPAIVSLDALPEAKLDAETYKIVPTADRQKATVKVKVRFTKIDPRLLPDMSAKITFIERRPDAPAGSSRVTVPTSAVTQKDGRSVVLLLINDRVQYQDVEVGGVNGSRVEILRGLAGGESVVVSGGEDLADGARVKQKAG